MKTLTLIMAPCSVGKIKVVEEVSIYCPNDKIYSTYSKDLDVTWLELEVRKARREVEEYKKRYENIFRGLCYWKSKARKNETM